MSGTGNSYAAAHLAGIAALVRSKHPDLRPFQVRTVLWARAAKVREAPDAAGRLSRNMRLASSPRASAALSAVASGEVCPGPQRIPYSLCCCTVSRQGGLSLHRRMHQSSVRGSRSTPLNAGLIR